LHNRTIEISIRQLQALFGLARASDRFIPKERIMDPVSLEVLKGRLDGIVQEMQVTLLNCSHSTIISESLDATSSIFNRKGMTVAQAVAIPIHLGVLTEIGHRLAKAYPEGVAQEGDVYIMNDPYAGGTHLPDIAVGAPAFVGGRLVGYVLTLTHHQDIGGSVPGSTAIKVHDHFAEGLRLPMLRMASGGIMNDEVLAIMMANSRTPANVRGDIGAQLASCRTGLSRFQALVESWGLEPVETGMSELMDYAERLTRAEIAKIKPGRYEFCDYLDDDGSTPDAKPLKIAVAMEVTGDAIHFDFTGTADQARTAINNVPYSAISTVYYAVRTLTSDSAPNNEGCYRPVTVHLPIGSLVNPIFPAPINARSVSLRRLVDVVMGVMGKAIPDQMTGANCGQSSLIHFGTVDEKSGKRIVATLGGPWMGGMGARNGKDGIDVTDHDASNVYHLPIEVSEAELPVIFHRVELWQDSGGGGRWRGGLGYHVEMEWLRGEASVTMRRDRHKFAPWGLASGLSAPFCKTQFQHAGREPEPIASKGSFAMHPGDRLLLWTTGSGGYGDPLDRNSRAIIDDVADGRVSLEQARDLYKVNVANISLDEPALVKAASA
jgi:N-methylhydantoinase B